MKTNRNFFKIAQLLFGIICVIALAGTMFPVLGLIGPGIKIAEAAVGSTIAGTATTEAIAAAESNLLRPEISKLITKVRRDVYPMDTIMREIGKVEQIDSTEYKYYTKAERGIKDITAAAYTYAGAQSANITITNPQYWQSHDMVIVPGITGGDGKKLRLMVASVDMTNNTIKVTPVNGRTSGSASVLGDLMPAIANETYLSRIGNAHGETDAQTDPVEIAPYDTSNYTQIFMAQVEESLVAKKHLMEVDMHIMDYKEDAIIDMRAQAELAMLFGYPKKDFYEPNLRKKVNLVGGADYYITKSKEYTKSVAITNDTFNAWAKYIFTGNNGSDKRILFAGNSLLERMQNADLVTKQLQGNGATEFVAGVRFNKIETAFGVLLVRRHQLFEEVYGYTDNGVVLDFEHIVKGIYETTQVTDLDLDKTGQKRVDAKRILEHWSLAFKNLDTHCWIKGV